MTEQDKLLELSKILTVFGTLRQNMSKEHNDFVASQFLKTYEVVTKTYVLQGRKYTGTFKEDVKRKYNRGAYEKEAKLATVLASFCFDVILIEENNSLPGKKPDAIVNGIVMDFKEIEAFSEKDAEKNTIGNSYRDGASKKHSEGVVMLLHDFSKKYVEETMKRELFEGKISENQNKLALFFHENTGTLQLLNMKEMETSHDRLRYF